MDTYNPDLAIGKLRGLPPRPKANGAPLEAEPTQPLPYLDMSSWDANPAPEREWAVVEVPDPAWLELLQWMSDPHHDSAEYFRDPVFGHWVKRVPESP